MIEKLLLLTFLLCHAEICIAQRHVTKDIDPDNIDFYLLTVGLGDTIAARYGHTIIRMVDKNSRRESNINWGMFNFADPYLPLNFFLGQLRYWVTDESSKRLYQRYRYFEKRPVVSEKINLTKKQKIEFHSLIIENLEPENRYFWYQYFYKNCSTIPRDYLDQVLQGVVMKRFEDQISETNFREYVRVNLNRPPIISFFLDIVMNSRLDAPLVKWTEMFYPPKLREYLLTLPAYDDAGIPIEGSKLLSESKIIVDLDDVAEDPWTLHPWFLGFNLLGFILSFAFFQVSKQGSLDLRRLGRVFQSFFLGFWAIFSSILGIIMLSSWVFSSHLDLHHNANLFLFWPIDFLFIIPCGSLLFLRKSSPPPLFLRMVFYLALAHLIVIPLWVLACLMGFIAQNCSLVILYIAPVAMLNYICVAYHYYQCFHKPKG